MKKILTFIFTLTLLFGVAVMPIQSFAKSCSHDYAGMEYWEKRPSEHQKRTKCKKCGKVKELEGWKAHNWKIKYAKTKSKHKVTNMECTTCGKKRKEKGKWVSHSQGEKVSQKYKYYKNNKHKKATTFLCKYCNKKFTPAAVPENCEFNKKNVCKYCGHKK